MSATSPIKPVFWSATELALWTGDIDVAYESLAVRMSGRVRLIMRPQPELVWDGSSDDYAVGAASLNHVWHASRPPAVSIPSPWPQVLGRRGVLRTSAPAGRVTDGGRVPDLDFGKDTSRVDQIVFNVINGPRLLGNVKLTSRSAQWLGGWEFADPNWRVRLDEPHSTFGRRSGHRDRFRFTHAAVLSRPGGRSFTVRQGLEALNDVFLYLTFVQGATVGVAMPLASSGGKELWARWTTGLSAPSSAHHSWADPHRASHISSLWPRFRTARADPRWSEAVGRAIRYYAEAVQARATEVTITLAQAGLELLATAVLVERDRMFAAQKFDSENAAWRLRKLLSAAGLSLAIPTTCVELSRAAKKHGWGDGPAAITQVRNTIAHWTSGKPAVDVLISADARQLSLQYFELALLWALGYDGDAFVRTTGPVAPGCSSTVPWAATTP